MKIEVDFKKSFLFLVIVSSVLYLGIFLINAYNDNFNQGSGQASVFGHSADEVVVRMSDGVTYSTVQELLSDGVQGGLTSITAGTGLTGGTITETGTIELDTSYTDTRYVRKTGDTMSGVLNMGGNRITNVATPSINSDVATKGYVDGVSSTGVPSGYVPIIPRSGNSVFFLRENFYNTGTGKLIIDGDWKCYFRVRNGQPQLRARYEFYGSNCDSGWVSNTIASCTIGYTGTRCTLGHNKVGLTTRMVGIWGSSPSSWREITYNE